MRRPLTIWATLSLIAAVLTSIVAGSSPSALASPAAPAQAPSPYGGSGSGSLIDLQAMLVDTELTHVILSPVSTSVDSETDPASIADGANLDAGLIDDAVPLDDVLTQAHQEAPPDNADPEVDGPLVPVPADPLLDLGVSTSSAHARWLEDGTCLPLGENLTRGYNETAGADVLNTGEEWLVSVNDAGGVSYTESIIHMIDGSPGRGLVSQSTTQVDEVSVLNGTPLELHIAVASTPTLTATATGNPGGASVEYSDPLVTISTPEGGALEDLSQLGEALDSALKDALALLGIEVLPGLDPLDPVVNVELFTGNETLTQEVADDGTSASGTVSVVQLRISVLEAAADQLGLPLTDITLDIGPMTAEAFVPEGGISCPPADNPLRDLHKDVSQAEVPPGGQFDYTLTIPNRGPCDLTDVVVTDTITSPPGTEITADPAADSVDGDTLTWNIGDLAVNETVTITVTVQVPDDAPDGFVFNDVLSASGDCDGTPVDHTVQLDAPEVSDDFTGPCDLGQSNKAASHLEVTPGQTFNYFIHVFNQGAEPCSDISVTDTLDDQVSFVSCTDGCTNSGQEVSWSGLSLPGGSGMTLTITVQAADDASGTLTNTAVIDSPDDPTGPHTVTHDGPDVTDQSVPAPPNPAVRGPQDAGPLPRTGAELPIALGAFGLLALAFLALRRRVSSLA